MRARLLLLLPTLLLFGSCTVNIRNITGAETVKGDLDLAATQRLRFSGDGEMTVKGNADLEGGIDCEKGSVALTVNGTVHLNGPITCNGRMDEEGVTMNGITIVAKNGIVVGPKATITSDGHVQIVDDPAKVLTAEAALERIYADVEEDTGTGPRIGPLVPGEEEEKEGTGAETTLIPPRGHASLLSSLTPLETPARVLFHSAPVAFAQGPAPAPCLDQAGNVVPNCVQIGGRWVIGGGEPPPADLDVPTPKKGVKHILLNFHFGPGKEVRLQDFSLSGPDGRNGLDDIGNSCNARGKDGEDAFRMRVRAGKIRIRNFDLTLGSGGPGGNAETLKDCYPKGTAKGGKGGKAGNFKMEADESFRIEGAFTIHPGKGGKGGDAIAHGKDGEDGCPGKKGGDASATAGAGGENKKELSIVGAVAGTENIEIDNIIGGEGGAAFAFPGFGGNGTGCKCDGGKGGDATATGGKGGDASFSGNAGRMHVDGDEGGKGGDATAIAKRGGNGGHCDPTGPGGNGGNGGNAKAKEGKGGRAKTPGEDGEVKDEVGGDGGNGGDGCPEGGGGAGGTARTPGKPGKPGKNICPPPAGGIPVIDGGGRASSVRSVTTSKTSSRSSVSSSSVSSSASSRSASISSKSSASSVITTQPGKPTVTGTSPQNGDTEVSVQTRVTITFNKPMNRSSLLSAINASFPYDLGSISDMSIELLPIGLEYDTWYDFRVSTLATDQSGNALTQTTQVKFKTEKKKTTPPPPPPVTQPPPPPPPPPPTTQTPPPPPPQETVRVAVIQGKKVPLTQLIVEGHDDCPNHYHAVNGAFVTALDGSQLPEPGGCQGYGLQSQVPIMNCTPDGSSCH